MRRVSRSVARATRGQRGPSWVLQPFIDSRFTRSAPTRRALMIGRDFIGNGQPERDGATYGLAKT
jgi:hypothetical protein